MYPNSPQYKEYLQSKLATVEALALALRNYLAIDIESHLNPMEIPEPIYDIEGRRAFLMEQLAQASDHVQNMETQYAAFEQYGNSADLGPIGPALRMLRTMFDPMLHSARTTLTSIQRELEEMESPKA